MKKHMPALGALFLVVLLAFAGCTGAGASSSEAAQPAQSTAASSESAAPAEAEITEGGEKTRVAMIFSGYRGDKSYLDFVYAGAARAMEDLDIDFKLLESDNSADWESNLVAMAEEGYDLVIGGSTQFAEIITRQAPNFPDVDFAVIDAVVLDQPNVVSASFSFADGAYLAGIAAATVANDTNIPGIDGNKVIGVVSALDVPPIQDAIEGFRKGVESVDPEIKLITSVVGGFNDPITAKSLTEAQIDQGASVLYAPAGGSSIGVLEAAVERGKYVVLFDAYEEGDYADAILTSVWRGIDKIVYEIIEKYTQGTFEAGTVYVNTVENGMTTLSDFENFKRITGDAFPADMVTEVDKAIAEMKDGTLVVKDEISGVDVE